jgi:hypothetical protein
MTSYLSTGQLKNLSSFLLDLTKILIGSAIVGFFIPGFAGEISSTTFIISVLCASALFFFGIKLTPKNL